MNEVPLLIHVEERGTEDVLIWVSGWSNAALCVWCAQAPCSGCARRRTLASNGLCMCAGVWVWRVGVDHEWLSTRGSLLLPHQAVGLGTPQMINRRVSVFNFGHPAACLCALGSCIVAKVRFPTFAFSCFTAYLGLTNSLLILSAWYWLQHVSVHGGRSCVSFNLFCISSQAWPWWSNVSLVELCTQHAGGPPASALK